MRMSFAGRFVSFGFDTCQRVTVGHPTSQPREEMHSFTGGIAFDIQSNQSRNVVNVPAYRVGSATRLTISCITTMFLRT